MDRENRWLIWKIDCYVWKWEFHTEEYGLWLDFTVLLSGKSTGICCLYRFYKFISTWIYLQFLFQLLNSPFLYFLHLIFPSNPRPQMNSDFVASIFQLIAKISKIMCRAINTLVPASHPPLGSHSILLWCIANRNYALWQGTHLVLIIRPVAPRLQPVC